MLFHLVKPPSDTPLYYEIRRNETRLKRGFQNEMFTFCIPSNPWIIQCLQTWLNKLFFKCINCPSEPEAPPVDLTDLNISETLFCSTCNTGFLDQTQQRQHYKLDWHRYNLKQQLAQKKTVSEEKFQQLAGNYFNLKSTLLSSSYQSYIIFVRQGEKVHLVFILYSCENVPYIHPHSVASITIFHINPVYSKIPIITFNLNVIFLCPLMGFRATLIAINTYYNSFINLIDVDDSESEIVLITRINRDTGFHFT